MEPIKINLTTPVNGRKTVNIVDMIEKKDELLIKLSGKECYDIHTGQELYFTKYIYENGRAFHTLIEKVTVIKEDEDHTIHTTLLPVNRVSLYNGEDSVRVVSGATETEGGEEPYTYHILKQELTIEYIHKI